MSISGLTLTIPPGQPQMLDLINKCPKDEEESVPSWCCSCRVFVCEESKRRARDRLRCARFVSVTNGCEIVTDNELP